MLPRLQAEEKIDRISELALGFGNVEQQLRIRAIDRLKRQALGDRFKARMATPAQLAGMGIAMETIGPEDGRDG